MPTNDDDNITAVDGGAPVAGTIIFDNVDNCVKYYNGTAWSPCIDAGGGGSDPTEIIRAAGGCSAYAAGILTAGTGRSNVPSDLLSFASKDGDVYLQSPGLNSIPDRENPVASNRLLSDALEADGATMIDYLFAGTDPTRRDYYHLALGDNGIIYWANAWVQWNAYSMSAGPEAVGQTTPPLSSNTVNTHVFKIEHPDSGRTFVALLGAANEDDGSDAYTANFALDDLGVVYSWGGRNPAPSGVRSRAAARFTSLFRANPANVTASTTPAPATFINNVIAAEGGMASYIADGGKHTATYFAEGVRGSDKSVQSEGVLFAFVSGNGDVIVLNSRATNANNATYYKYTLPDNPVTLEPVKAISVGSINGHSTLTSAGKTDYIFAIGDDGNVYMNDAEVLASFYTGKHTIFGNYLPPATPVIPATEELKKIIDKDTEQNIVDMIGVDRTNYQLPNGEFTQFSLLLLTEDGKYFAWNGFRNQDTGTNSTTFFPSRPEVELTSTSVFEPNVEGNPGTNQIPPIARFITTAHGDDNVTPRAFGLIAETTTGETIYVANFANAQIRNAVNGTPLFHPPVPALTGSPAIESPANTAAHYYIITLDGSLLIEGPIDSRDPRIFDQQRYFTLISECISK